MQTVIIEVRRKRDSLFIYLAKSEIIPVWSSGFSIEEAAFRHIESLTFNPNLTGFDSPIRGELKEGEITGATIKEQYIVLPHEMRLDWLTTLQQAVKLLNERGVEIQIHYLP